MTFETFFRLISFTAVFCGFFSLWVSGTFGPVATVLFLIVIGAAWFLEDTRWQVSERIGTTLIVLALPAFLLAWRFDIISLSGDSALPGMLARLILSLSAIKLLQQKSSRDWVFLYLMSFFEVMLAAGLSISPLYLASFVIYVVVIVCAIVTFEIRKTAASLEGPRSHGLIRSINPVTLPTSRLPAASVILIVFMALIAVPMFFMLPRVSGAGFGGSHAGLSVSSGFSDTVKLGEVGAIQENDAVVMRVKRENGPEDRPLYFRGIALDTFNNQSWRKSSLNPIVLLEPSEGDRIVVDNARSRDDLAIHTIYLEPLDAPYLFAVPRALVIQGNFPVLYRDPFGALTFISRFERTSYRVLSDRSVPPASVLRADMAPYEQDTRNFRQLPRVYDVRIAELAEAVTAGATNRFDKAVAIESYLQTAYGYTLDRRASGREPLADFLFNVREGHCEYFATAMAIMLRTQGIATRVVNGFHGGEYNDAAGVTIVRQRNAHAWVEVYFPGEDVWVTFDPTPAAGLNSIGAGAGFSGSIKKYFEALEAFWIQYFVAFDNQEQRSLVHSIRGGLVGMQLTLAPYLEALNDLAAEWWAEVQGQAGAEARLYAIGRLVATVGGLAVFFFLFRWLYRRAKKWPFLQRLRRRVAGGTPPTIIEFYERMLNVLAARGLRREPFQTPMEFAASLDMTEAVMITEKYNRVRFGEKDLSPDEAGQIDLWLRRMTESP